MKTIITLLAIISTSCVSTYNIPYVIKEVGEKYAYGETFTGSYSIEIYDNPGLKVNDTILPKGNVIFY